VVLAIVPVAGEDSLGDAGGEVAVAAGVGTTSCAPLVHDFDLRVSRSGRNSRIQELDVSVKVVAAINGMNKLGHDAHLYKHQGKMWVEIDQCMLATFEEIEELVDGVHLFEEVAELFKQRHANILGAPNPRK